MHTKCSGYSIIYCCGSIIIIISVNIFIDSGFINILTLIGHKFLFFKDFFGHFQAFMYRAVDSLERGRERGGDLRKWLQVGFKPGPLRLGDLLSRCPIRHKFNVKKDIELLLLVQLMHVYRFIY